MAIGKKNRANLTAYSLRIRTKDLPAPIFEVQKKVGEKQYENQGTTDTISGNLVGVKAKTFTWEGQDIRSVDLSLVDNEEIYFVSIPETMLGMGIVNSVLNLTAFNDVELGLYQTKPKEGQTKTYNAAALRQDGQLVKWKYGNDELPAPDEVVFKGKTQRDYSKRWDFLVKELEEVASKIKENQKNEEPSKEHDETGSSSQELGDEDVPF